MAKHTSNALEFLVLTTREHLQSLSQIRHFSNLKVAFKDNDIWIKDFSLDQIDSTEVSTLPFKSIFYLKDNLLFPKGSLLPKAKLPSLLLWTPIVQALVLKEPKINHNYFGIYDTIIPKIIPSKEEQSTVAILVTINTTTKKTIESTAAYRFKDLNYTILNSNTLLIIGTPTLPLQGESYWLDNHFLFPNGYHLEYPILSSSIAKQINPSNSHYVLWHKNSSYSLIPKLDCIPLTISSFRRSLSLSQV
jgi:hypothetical protein